MAGGDYGGEASNQGGGLSSNTQGILGGLLGGGLAGINGLFQGRPQTTTTNTDTKQNYNTSSTPTYSSHVLPLYNQLISQYMGLSNPQAEDQQWKGYQSGGQQQINDTSNAGANSIQQLLAKQGLSYSPNAGNAGVQQELSRQAQMSQFNNSIPLLRNQDIMSKLQQTGTFFNALPVGTQATGDQTTNVVKKETTPNTSTQGLAQGLLGGLSAALPALLAI